MKMAKKTLQYAMSRYTDNEGLDQTTLIPTLIWVFVARIRNKGPSADVGSQDRPPGLRSEEQDTRNHITLDPCSCWRSA